MYPNLVKVNADLIEFGYFEVLTLLFWLGHGEKYLIESNSLFLSPRIKRWQVAAEKKLKHVSSFVTILRNNNKRTEGD
jgi:hypothetical protein